MSGEFYTIAGTDIGCQRQSPRASEGKGRGGEGRGREGCRLTRCTNTDRLADKEFKQIGRIINGRSFGDVTRRVAGLPDPVAADVLYCGAVLSQRK